MTTHDFTPVPGTLRILLHLFVTPAPYPLPERDAPFYREAVNMLAEHGLITAGHPRNNEDEFHGWAVTSRGRAYIRLLLATPLPVTSPAWQDPRTGEYIPHDR